MSSVSSLCALCFASSLFVGAARAIDPDEQLSDPAQEARARAITKQLRCPTCQSSSIDESNASLAHDLRVLVRERIKAGDDDEQVVDYIAARYGDYIRLQPAVEGRTLLLWAGPALFLILGAGVVYLVVSQARRTPIDDDEASGDASGTETPA